jgi:hypothetical protein
LANPAVRNEKGLYAVHVALEKDTKKGTEESASTLQRLDRLLGTTPNDPIRSSVSRASRAVNMGRASEAKELIKKALNEMAGEKEV